jgi:hypothetical protein
MLSNLAGLKLLLSRLTPRKHASWSSKVFRCAAGEIDWIALL